MSSCQHTQHSTAQHSTPARLAQPIQNSPASTAWVLPGGKVGSPPELEDPWSTENRIRSHALQPKTLTRLRGSQAAFPPHILPSSNAPSLLLPACLPCLHCLYYRAQPPPPPLIITTIVLQLRRIAFASLLRLGPFLFSSLLRYPSTLLPRFLSEIPYITCLFHHTPNKPTILRGGHSCFTRSLGKPRLEHPPYRDVCLWPTPPLSTRRHTPSPLWSGRTSAPPKMKSMKGLSNKMLGSIKKRGGDSSAETASAAGSDSAVDLQGDSPEAVGARSVVRNNTTKTTVTGQVPIMGIAC